MTDGDQVVYSSGAADGPDAEYAPDLYSYEPGDPDAHVVFANPDRDSNLFPVSADGRHFAFVESNARLYGQAGWGLWYFNTEHGQPVLIDSTEGDAEVPSPPPAISISGDRMVWHAFHQTPDGPRSELLMVELPDGEPTVLASSDPETGEQYWFPDLDGDRIVYGVADYSGGDTAVPLYVYLLDVSLPGQAPRRLDDSGRATTPAINGDDVVWKEAANVFEWGSVVHYSLADGTEEQLQFGSQPSLNYPTVGDRFVGAWGRDDKQLVIYDLEQGRSDLIGEALAPTSLGAMARPYISGDLLAWVSIDGLSEDLHLNWAQLPHRAGAP